MDSGPIDRHRYLLAEGDSIQIFRDKILPLEIEGKAESVAGPVVVFVAGQPGSGKTGLTASVVEGFASVGGCLVINSDYYKPYHPMWVQLMAEDDTTAAPFTSADGRRWMAQAEDWAIRNRVNVVIETTMRDPGDFEEPAHLFRDNGYAVDVVVLAVPEAWSRLGILTRYAEMVAANGAGRLTEVSNHDAAYAGVLNAMRHLDAQPSVDVLSVWRRGGELLYANQTTPAGWAAPATAAHAVEHERTRPWTEAEASRFLQAVGALRTALPASLHDQVTDVRALGSSHLPSGAEAAALAAALHPRITNPLTRSAALTETAGGWPGGPQPPTHSPGR